MRSVPKIRMMYIGPSNWATSSVYLEHGRMYEVIPMTTGKTRSKAYLLSITDDLGEQRVLTYSSKEDAFRYWKEAT